MLFLCSLFMASVTAMGLLVNVLLMMIQDCISVTVLMEHVGRIVNNAAHCLTMLPTTDTEQDVLVSIYLHIMACNENT